MAETSGYGTASASTEQTGYSAFGEVAHVRDGNDNRTSYAYDGLGRLKRTYYPVATLGANASSSTDYEEYTYRPNGDVESLRKRDGKVLTYYRDDLGLTAISVPDGGGLPASTTRDKFFGYDLLNRQAFVRFDSVAGEGVTNVFDALGRLTSQTQSADGQARTLHHYYDLAGNRTQVTHPDGAYFTYPRDPLGRVTSVLQNGGAHLKSYGYDGFGRLSSAVSLGSWGPFTSSLGYDVASNLQTLSHDLGGTAGDVTTTFGYDPASAIVSRTQNNASYAYVPAAGTRGYTRNGLNQYSSVTGTATNSYSYDLNGNLTSDGIATYGYDVENRLISVVGGGRNTSLKYDVLGRLYEVAANTGTTRFLYDGDNLIGEYDTAGTLISRYVHGTSTDEPVAWYKMSDGWPSYLRGYAADERGSIVAVTDGVGTPLITNTYDEYGIPGATNGGRFQYTGQIYLPEAGVYYYKARMYSPVLGRFMQTDPIGYGDGMNWYHYVGGDPVNKRDPSGTQDQPVPGPISGPLEATCYCIRGEQGRAIGGAFDFYVISPIATFLDEARSRAASKFAQWLQKAQMPCPTGSRLTLGGGGSGTLFAFLGASAGGSVGASIPYSSLPLVGDGSFRGTQLSGSVSITPMAGVGAFAGLGPGYSGGNAGNASRSGFSGSSSTVVQFGAGDGGGVEVSGVLGSDQNYGGSMSAKGAVGAYGAIGQQFSGNYNSPPLGCL